MQIGILEAGHMAAPLRHELGDYSDLFRQLFAPHGLSFHTWDVEGMAFPDSVHAADGWLITGSRHGVYEDHPFLPPLEAFIRAAHAADVPMVGICFGHQVMAQALGGRVEKFAGGWSVGAQSYRIEGQDVTLNAWHQDQVIVPPEGAETVGHSAFCAHAALRYGDWGLSLQPHPEFGRDVIAGMIAQRGPGTVPDALLATAQARLETPTDRPDMARRLAQFLTTRS
ncbi:type 1 glutamine amidotransferase [Rhodovulum adriaticum]|uniref:GMP synthase (Glutamine-hydrolysing) n=1 Tax=Rhodovulum adriaticum TaxID=35804 RepID=A0A4V2SMA3_RHOAD|nr:type 1 glutamine amidotransferase [Rhodovulum adriaticum]MBK1635280.1 glutamine amidotransferase [Rhodovulum adriaticum]TCP26416.1 GMP synthase (glutamine-hydrolysing) [Rhodovulum adriaticum]